MLIHIYKGTPTAGNADGTEVSEETGLAPISIGPLDCTSEEVSDPVKLGIRCEAGYQTTGDVTITPAGTTANMWALAPDNAGSAGVFGAYGAALTISSVIGATNTIFWAKAKTEDETLPVNDATVDLQVEATIEAV